LSFDIEKIRNEFPILKQQINGNPLVYLDNAATTQKPQPVIDRVSSYYMNENCNIHRGVHHLSVIATEAFEKARLTVKEFINAEKREEVIFTRGTTESINLVATAFGREVISAGDEIIISALEHHSNLVPWQMLCKEKDAVLKVIPINDAGELELDQYKKMLNPRTKIVAVSHVSNALGIINPIERIIEEAHKKGIPVLIDGAQAAAHLEIDVQSLDCEFYCFSGHKVYGPMGGGILYGKEELLENMQPYQGGGEMVDNVTFRETTYNELPFKFEAGTPNVESVLGLSTALQYIHNIGFKEIALYEHELLQYATEKISSIDGLTIYGTSPEKTSIISFLVDDIHPYDAGTIIDKMGIAVRTGHHCAQPVMDRLNIPGTIRASLAVYNTIEDIDRLVEAIYLAKQMFA
jgi:cysteine desulfurase/selenocysteine lyase